MHETYEASGTSVTIWALGHMRHLRHLRHMKHLRHWRHLRPLKHLAASETPETKSSSLDMYERGKPNKWRLHYSLDNPAKMTVATLIKRLVLGVAQAIQNIQMIIAPRLPTHPITSNAWVALQYAEILSRSLLVWWLIWWLLRILDRFHIKVPIAKVMQNIIGTRSRPCFKIQKVNTHL